MVLYKLCAQHAHSAHAVRKTPPFAHHASSDYRAVLYLMVDLHLHACHLHVHLYLDNCIQRKMQINKG